jgi:RND family efflux transporter MFP subunit
MRYRSLFIAVYLSLVSWSCSSDNSPEAPDTGVHSHGESSHVHADSEASVSVTYWSDDLELFMEHPPLQVGHLVKFAVHLTKLDDFEPLSEGPVLFRFVKPGGKPKMVTVGRPDRPGIFGPSLTFDEPGEYTLRLEVVSDELETSLSYGPIEVAEGAIEDAGETEVADTVSYLKEQQWKLPFTAEVVERRTIEQTLRVSARIVPKAGMDAVVLASVNGRYRPPSEGVPRLGMAVQRGDPLGYMDLLPLDETALVGGRVETEVTLSRLAEEIIKAEATVVAEKERLEVAKKEADRVEKLVEAGALPRKRLDQAGAEVRIRLSALKAADQVLASHQEIVSRFDSTRGGTGTSSGPISLEAPIAGVIMDVSVVAGSYRAGRDPLFRIVDTREVWVQGEVFEKDLVKLKSLDGAYLQLPGLETYNLAAGDLVHIGARIDSNSRTLPVIWEVANANGEIRLGTLGRLSLRTGKRTDSVAVPRSAVLFEESRSVVYVQQGGETFERRFVKTGIEDQEWVEILEGLELGERIVTTGSYDVALAARSSELPEHGHVH